MTDIVAILGFALDGVSTEQDAIANNVANMQTPGYTAQTVSFQQSLAAAMENGGNATITVASSSSPPASDGNNVDMTTELVSADEATLQYQSLSNCLNDQFRLVSGAAGGSFS